MEAKQSCKSAEVGGYSTCATCGKKVYTAFYNLDEWAYKRAQKFYCSYTCMQRMYSTTKTSIQHK